MTGSGWKFKFLNDDQLSIALDLAIPAKEAAVLLDRSSSAIYQMRRKAREGTLTLRSSWSDDDIDFLINNKFMSVSQLSSYLGRSQSAVHQMKMKLRREQGVDFHRGSKEPTSIAGRRLLAKTCPACGLLLDAEWFRAKEYRGEIIQWASNCKKCQSGRGSYPSKMAMRKYQEISLQFATKQGQEWSEDDYATLEREDMSILEKALELGRTWNGVKYALGKFELGFRKRLGDPAEGQWQIKFPEAS